MEDLKHTTKNIAAFAYSHVDEATKHMAWILLAKTAARSHDFDAKLLAPCKVAGILAAAAVEVKRAAQQVIAVPMGPKGINHSKATGGARRMRTQAPGCTRDGGSNLLGNLAADQNQSAAARSQSRKTHRESARRGGSTAGK